MPPKTSHPVVQPAAQAPVPIVPPLPPVAPPAVAPAVVGAILEPPPPPESVGTREFHTPTAEELAAFEPPPPIAPPPALMTNHVHGQSSEAGDGTAGDFETGGRPVPVVPPPPEEFDDPLFTQLPRRVQAEIRAGHAAVQGKAETFRYVPPEPEPVVAPVVEAKPAPDVIDWDKVPPKIRKELEAGKRRLLEKSNDYREVQRRVREQEAKELYDGKVGTLDYPAR